MKGWNPEGNLGPKKPLPDTVTILEPPIDKVVGEPSSEQRAPMGQDFPPAAPVQEPTLPPQDQVTTEPTF